MRIDTRENLDKGRFARAIFADKGMNLAVIKIETDPVEGLHTREGLRNQSHFEKSRGSFEFRVSSFEFGLHTSLFQAIAVLYFVPLSPERRKYLIRPPIIFAVSVARLLRSANVRVSM